MGEEGTDFSVLAKEAVWVVLASRQAGASVTDAQWGDADPLRRLAGQLGAEAGDKWLELQASGDPVHRKVRQVLRFSAERYGEFAALQAFLAAALTARLVAITGESPEEIIDDAFDWF